MNHREEMFIGKTADISYEGCDKDRITSSSRRSFLGLLLGAGAAGVGALLSVPLFRFLLHPCNRNEFIVVEGSRQCGGSRFRYLASQEASKDLSSEMAGARSSRKRPCTCVRMRPAGSVRFPQFVRIRMLDRLA